MSDLLAIDEALELVLGRVRPLPAEDVPVAGAAGRVLAEDARAQVDLPPFDSSAMDGYAVRAADTPGRLRLVGHAAAGRPFASAVEPGTCVEISTGAVVPDGADAVVPVEQAVVHGGEVELGEAAAGAHVRKRGGDVRRGAVVVPAGTRLGPPQLGALAAAGAAAVRCARRPLLALVATGTELRQPGEQLRPGEIYESNSVLISAQAASAGARVEVLEPVADDSARTRAVLERALDADVVVTTGGVSVGPHDLVRATLADLGAEEVLWRVAMRPGKPVAFAVRGSTLVFGLPGNPVSALVGFELFVRPALLALQGARDPAPPYRTGVLGAAVVCNAARESLVRARTSVADGDVVLEPLGRQESHMIVGAAEADALVRVERGDGRLEAGARVRYLAL
ncbi:MAG TPA: gephyrin-like molybdotransferase Glp [Gaiellaceae bacterium]|nr:gephyrin-like molybdotransferase Glp [Gaiellaceae bacterium]